MHLSCCMSLRHITNCPSGLWYRLMSYCEISYSYCEMYAFCSLVSRFFLFVAQCAQASEVVTEIKDSPGFWSSVVQMPFASVVPICFITMAVAPTCDELANDAVHDVLNERGWAYCRCGAKLPRLDQGEHERQGALVHLPDGTGQWCYCTESWNSDSWKQEDAHGSDWNWNHGGNRSFMTDFLWSSLAWSVFGLLISVISVACAPLRSMLDRWMQRASRVIAYILGQGGSSTVQLLQAPHGGNIPDDRYANEQEGGAIWTRFLPWWSHSSGEQRPIQCQLGEQQSGSGATTEQQSGDGASRTTTIIGGHSRCSRRDSGGYNSSHRRCLPSCLRKMKKLMSRWMKLGNRSPPSRMRILHCSWVDQDDLALLRGNYVEPLLFRFVKSAMDEGQRQQS